MPDGSHSRSFLGSIGLHAIDLAGEVPLKRRMGKEVFMIADDLKAALICLCAPALSDNSVTQTPGVPIKNIVRVHRTRTEGSDWRSVYDIFVEDGFKVCILQEPGYCFQEDRTAAKRILELHDGSSMLIRRSYRGAVITEAANHSSVAGLVSVAAHMPDTGENEANDLKRFPSNLSKSDGTKRAADVFTYLNPAQFHDHFAAHPEGPSNPS